MLLANSALALPQGFVDVQMQAWYYPRINKKMLFEENYIAEFSSYNRGSIVDITLISLSKTLHAIKPERRILEDGTVDMGSSFYA